MLFEEASVRTVKALPPPKDDGKVTFWEVFCIKCDWSAISYVSEDDAATKYTSHSVHSGRPSHMPFSATRRW